MVQKRSISFLKMIDSGHGDDLFYFIRKTNHNGSLKEIYFKENCPISRQMMCLLQEELLDLFLRIL